MSPYELTPDERARDDEIARENSRFSLAPPSFFDGALSAIPGGIVSGLEKLYHVIRQPEEEGPPEEPQPKPQNTYEQLQQVANNNSAWYEYDPATEGFLARVLHGVSEGVTIAAPGLLAGGPLLAAATAGYTEGYDTTKTLEKQDIDSATAKIAGVASGLFSGGSMFLPLRFSGSGLMTSLLTGSSAQVAAGTANRTTMGTILRSQGYNEQADQYRAFDINEMLADAVTGAALGGLAHLHAESHILPSTVDDAQMTLDGVHLTRDAAPGIPVNPEAANLHIQTMEKTLADFLTGKESDIDPDTAKKLASNMIFDDRPENPVPVEIPGQAKMEIKPSFEISETTAPLSNSEEKDPLGEMVNPAVLDMVSQLKQQDPEGTQELYDSLREDAVQAKVDEKLHTVAVNCFLRTGGL